MGYSIYRGFYLLFHANHSIPHSLARLLFSSTLFSKRGHNYRTDLVISVQASPSSSSGRTLSIAADMPLSGEWIFLTIGA